MIDRRWFVIWFSVLGGQLLPGCQRGSAVVPPPVSLPARAPIVTDPLDHPEPELPADPLPEVPDAPLDLSGDWQPQAAPREWTSLVIHHTATDQGSVESIHEAHVRRKWLGIGYHFVIGNGKGMPDGAVEPTFRWRQQLQGAHAGSREYNDHGIGICLVGNFETAPPTAAQLDSLKQLLQFLAAEYQIPASQLMGHNELKATACPGQHFPLDEVRHSLPSTPGTAQVLPRPTPQNITVSSVSGDFSP